MMTQTKQALRETALARRNSQTQQEDLSLLIQQRLVALPEYQTAHVLLIYLDVRSEVRTRGLVSRAMTEKRVFIPFCTRNELELFELRDWNDLQPGRFGILEPRLDLRGSADQSSLAREVQLAVLPGVAFDRQGGRLGYGKGFFDRLLPKLNPSVPRIALAFESQLLESIPMESHDYPMNLIITEKANYSA